MQKDEDLVFGKKTSKTSAHLRSVDIAITTFYQKRTENFDYTDSG